MIDCRSEENTHPAPFPINDYQRVLALAPHPDDEVYGCGGLILLARQSGASVSTLVLTDGCGFRRCVDLARRRREESVEAAQILGHEVAFLDFRDRSLRLDATLIDALRDWLDRIQPDLVLAPSLTDSHPDHQATALAAIRLLGCLPHRADLAFYETIGGLTHVTHLLDISPVRASKDAAMAVYASQEQEQPYRSRIGARDHYRAFTLGPTALAAEAYGLAPLRDKGFAALIPLLDPLYRHHRLDAAASPEDTPLVSVIIRTIGDPRLEEAVASILAQSYRPIEIIVVAAHRQDPFLTAPALVGLPFMRCVVPDKPLDRPGAANVGLDNAQGTYLLFLDEDDLLLPDHLEKLVSALREHPEVKAAYSDVRVIGREGDRLRDYAHEVHIDRLLGANLLPIQSVMFDRSLVTQYGCRFDDTLPKYEDWDFWLQLAQHTSFLHVPGVSAVYRYQDRARLSCQDGCEYAEAIYRRVLAKWRARLGPERSDAALLYHARSIAMLEDQLHSERSLAAQAEAKAAQAEAYVTVLQSRHDQMLAEIRASTSWRLTAPLRWLAAKVHRR